MAPRPSIDPKHVTEFAEGIYTLHLEGRLTDEEVGPALAHLWTSNLGPLTTVTQALAVMRKLIANGSAPKSLATWWGGFMTERGNVGRINGVRARYGEGPLTLEEFRMMHPNLAFARAGKAPLKKQNGASFVGNGAAAAVTEEAPPEDSPLPLPDTGIASPEMALHMMPTIKQVIGALEILRAAQLIEPEAAFDIIAKYADLES